MKKYKDKIKLSNLLLDAFNNLKKSKLRHLQGKLEDFNLRCSDVAKNSSIFNTAVSKGWYKSAEKIRSKVSRNLCDFSYYLNQFKDLVNSAETKDIKLSDIFADLDQIEQEFGELNFDLNEKTISVITNPIELDEIPFGPFEIKLFIDEIGKLYSNSPYKVIALEPNPAATDCNVTHPHVSHEKLCEGDGVTTIRAALEQGRLTDFFTMVKNILTTYNPDSPYVSLDSWEGIACYDCGYIVSGDECYYCEDCERDYCSSCSTYCQLCDTTICLGCSYECPACGQPVCRHCTAVCLECEETLCKDCVDEDGLCRNCQEERKEQENEEENQQTKELQTNPAVQPDSMGKTALHA